MMTNPRRPGRLRHKGTMPAAKERRRRPLSFYIFTGISLLVALTLVLPFCGSAGSP